MSILASSLSYMYFLILSNIWFTLYIVDFLEDLLTLGEKRLYFYVKKFKNIFTLSINTIKNIKV